MTQILETKPQPVQVAQITNPQVAQVSQTCPLCLQEYKTGYTISSCQHTLCSPCFNSYITTLINTGTRRLEKFTCPEDSCQHLITERELEQSLDFKLFDKIANKVEYEHTILCPSCAMRSDLKNTEEVWFCQHCWIEICKFCKSLTHDGNCQQSVNYFHEMRATFFDSEEIGYCPECKIPFLKDENCDHVTCDNPDCAFEFCFYCSVSYSPINNHGAHYHRTDCRNFDSGEYDPFYSEDCMECQKMGETEACKQPEQTKEYYINELIQQMEGMTLNG